MDKITIEVLERIFNHIDDKKTLKALRLVNKNFANIAERTLFKTLIVFQRMGSWPKIESIAHCPRLAQLVKKLELVPLIVGLGLFTRLRSTEYTGAFPRPPRTAPSLPLPALSEIETVWPPHLCSRTRGPNFSLGILDLFGPSNELCNAHLSFSLRFLHDNGLKITTLELHQYGEILLNQIDWVGTLIYLKNLKLNLRHLLDVDRKQAMALCGDEKRFKWKLAPYLADAENLETLIITQDPLVERYTERFSVWFDIISILSTAPWPKLRSVWFGENFARATSMLHFMMKHGKSLRSIHLDHPVDREIPWQRLASDLRTQHANHDCVVSSRDDTIFHSKSACIEE